MGKIKFYFNILIDYIPLIFLFLFCFSIYEGFYSQVFLLSYISIFLIPYKLDIKFKLILYIVLNIITIPLFNFISTDNFYIFFIILYYLLTLLLKKYKYIFAFLYILPYIIYYIKPGLLILWFSYFQIIYYDIFFK